MNKKVSLVILMLFLFLFSGCVANPEYQNKIKDLNATIVEKENRIIELDSIIKDKENNLNEINKDIISKNNQLKELQIRVEEAILNKKIDDIKREVTDKFKNYPDKIKIDYFRDEVMGGMNYNIERSEEYSIGGGESIPKYWIDVFTFVSKIDKEYNIEVRAKRYTHGLLAPDDFYSEIEVIVENQNEKYICSRE